MMFCWSVVVGLGCDADEMTMTMAGVDYPCGERSLGSQTVRAHHQEICGKLQIVAKTFMLYFENRGCWWQ